MSNNYPKDFIVKVLNEFNKGDKSKAFNDLENYLLKNSADLSARYNFAVMCKEVGRVDAAILNYKMVIKSDKFNWQSRFNLYLIYLERELYGEALNYVNEVLEIKKGFQPAQRDKALILYYLKEPDKAFEYIVSSLKQEPKDFLALNTLGLILIALERITDAKNTFIRAIEINSKYVSSHNNLGHCYTLLNDRDNAFKSFQAALAIDPNSYSAKNNLANYFIDSGDYKKALEFYFQALKLEPQNNKLLFNIGIAYINLNEENKAEDYFKKSYALDPNNETLHKNFSMLLLRQGRYKEAWNFFDGRLKLNAFYAKNTNLHNINKKLSKNKKFSRNDKILVVREQGVGDEILYATMYSDMINTYSNAIFEADKRLISVFERSLNQGNEKIFFPYGYFTSNEKKLDEFDNIIFSGSLGQLFRNDINDFSGNSFLKPDTKKITSIKNVLNNIGKEKKIGISWKSQKTKYGEDKSKDLEHLIPILNIENLKFINLQYGDMKNEIDNFRKKENIEIITLNNVDLFNDFESISAILKNLDLFVTVSNSTAHLAGALGVKTFLIRPQSHATFHYWDQKGKKTPWYNSIKLFNYENAVEKIRKEIIEMFK